MKTKELSPCPFCGSETRLYEFYEVQPVGPALPRYTPGCPTEGCLIEGLIEVWFHTKEEAATAWNHRIIPFRAIIVARDALESEVVQGRGGVRKHQLKENMKSLAELDAWLQLMEPSC